MGFEHKSPQLGNGTYVCVSACLCVCVSVNKGENCRLTGSLAQIMKDRLF